MPELTHCRRPEQPDRWTIYYGVVAVGTILRVTGNPVQVDDWEWTCSLYPGMEPGRDSRGSAPDFDQARLAFKAAWLKVLSTVAESNFQEWRDQCDWTVKKYAIWERGEKIPTQKPKKHDKMRRKFQQS